MNYELFTISFFALALCGNHANAEDLLLKEVLAGHLAARQAIHSFSADFVVEDELPFKGVYLRGKYWRSKETIRIRYERSKSQAKFDYLKRPGDILNVTRADWVNGQPNRFYAERLPGNEKITFADMWVQMGLDLLDPQANVASYETIIIRAARVEPCRKITWNNRPCIQVVIHEFNEAKEELTTTLTHDIGYNYMIVEMIGKTSYDTSVKTTTKYFNFSEVRPGLFFPLNCLQETERKGKVTDRSTIALSGLVINQPETLESLALPEIPDGTPLNDKVAGIKGTIDSTWNWIEQTGKTQPARVLPPEFPSSQKGPSIDEPTSFWSWIFLFGGIFFAVTGAILIYLKSRKCPSHLSSEPRRSLPHALVLAHNAISDP